MLAIVYPLKYFIHHLVNSLKSLFFWLFNFSAANKILEAIRGVLQFLTGRPFFDNYFAVD